MTAKELLTAALKGEPVPRIPWSPFLAYWWDAQSPSLQKMGEVEFLKSIGADPLIRGHHPWSQEGAQDLVLYSKSVQNCQTRSTASGDLQTVFQETPVGTLESVYRYTPASNSWFLVGHPLKEEEDFKTLTYIMEHTVLEPNYTAFDTLSQQYGEEALLVPLLPPCGKSSFQSLLENWVGVENLAYAMADYEDTVLETLHAMKTVSIRAAEIAADSKAEFVISWEDSSTTNTSPFQFAEYIMPEINRWCDILHAGGKRFIHHACGHLRNLLPTFATSKIDCIESISPPPTGNISLQEARPLLPSNIALIGGVEPTVFLNAPEEELLRQTQDLCDTLDGTAFILANSDSCPPGVSLEKFKSISAYIRNR